jgi:hypothetical protein
MAGARGTTSDCCFISADLPRSCSEAESLLFSSLTLYNLKPGAILCMANSKNAKDFAGMDRTSIDVPGRKPGSIRSFTGVALAQLLPATGSREAGDRTYEIHSGFFHRQVICESELKPGSDLLIADEVNRKTVDRGALFWLTGQTHDGQPIVIGKDKDSRRRSAAIRSISHHCTIGAVSKNHPD